MMKSVAHKVVVSIFKHWTKYFTVASGLYIFLALLTPLLIINNTHQIARALYNTYSLFCHQNAYKSWVLVVSQSTLRIGLSPSFNFDKLPVYWRSRFRMEDSFMPPMHCYLSRGFHSQFVVSFTKTPKITRTALTSRHIYHRRATTHFLSYNCFPYHRECIFRHHNHKIAYNAYHNWRIIWLNECLVLFSGNR